MKTLADRFEARVERARGKTWAHVTEQQRGAA
jgi:hypothetical protein